MTTTNMRRGFPFARANEKYRPSEKGRMVFRKNRWGDGPLVFRTIAQGQITLNHFNAITDATRKRFWTISADDTYGPEPKRFLSAPRVIFGWHQ